MYKFSSLLFTFILTSISAYSQESEYFISVDNKKCGPEKAVLYRKVQKANGVWNVKDYYIDEKSLQMEGTYADDSLKDCIGTFYYYHSNRQLERKGRFIAGKRDGIWKAYSESGRLVDSMLFKGGLPSKFSYRWHDSGEVALVGNYNDDGSGEEVIYYTTGTVDTKGKYSAGHLKDSLWIYNYESGSPACVETYNKGVLLNVACLKEDGTPDSCWPGFDTFLNKQMLPVLMGCSSGDRGKDELYAMFMPEAQYNVNRYLAGEINYPEAARNSNAQGTVYVQFAVSKTGLINEVKLVSSGKLGMGLDEEALRVIKKMPKWKPGRAHNRPAKVYFTIPVKFSLH